MVFSSLVFLTIYFPAVFLLYFSLFKTVNGRNYFLLASGILFYAWGEPFNSILLLLVCWLAWAAGLKIHKSSAEKTKWILPITVGILLVPLIYFKYFGFLVLNANQILSVFNWREYSFPALALPAGISFFTFQAISYVIDVRRGTTKPATKLSNFALYITLFPHLIAGPIVRYSHIADQIENRFPNTTDIYEGLRRFTKGLAKKVVIANVMGEMVDKLYLEGSSSGWSTEMAWTFAFAYSFQIYFDFSGYSDMAIGIGRVFGFHFHENFNFPYMASSITDFWRRWHISLSTWFRDYVYIPLGGNRLGKRRTYTNLFIVFLLTGLWHGANYTFLFWGLWHGSFIALEKYFDIKPEKLSILRWCYTLIIVIVGWVFFRAEDITSGFKIVQTMFGFGSLDALFRIEYFLGLKQIVALILACTFATPLPLIVAQKALSIPEPKPFIKDFGYLALLFVCLVLLINLTYNPFIYFRF